jgi:hypothetical protein
MARSLKTGSKVRVLRGPFLKQEGVVLEAVGSGRSRKWKVRFGSGLESEFAARTLELCGVPQASNGSSKQKSPAAPACAGEIGAGQCADDSSACESLEEGSSSEMSDAESDRASDASVGQGAMR